MTELSNAAQVLISRMESHPQDFEYGARFGYLQEPLHALIGVGSVSSNIYGGVGRLAYLNDTDKAAVAEAWRALNYKALEKEIMDAVFKSDSELEDEKKKYAYPLSGQQQGLAQHVALQNQMLAASTGTYQTHPLQNSSGFLGSIGSALGITK